MRYAEGRIAEDREGSLRLEAVRDDQPSAHEKRRSCDRDDADRVEERQVAEGDGLRRHFSD